MTMQEKREKKRFFMKALRCQSDCSVFSNRETMTKYKLELESPRSNMIVSRIAKKNGCLTFCLSPGCRRIESDKRKHLQSWELSLTELRSCFFPPNCFTVASFISSTLEIILSSLLESERLTNYTTRITRSLRNC